MKILFETGWSEYIPGGIIHGAKDVIATTPEDEIQSRELIIEMVRDFIERNPNEKERILKEFDLHMTDF